MRVRVGAALVACLLPLAAWAEENVDLSVIHRIKQESFESSRVMDHLFFLTDVNGPRLTGSPGFRAAADWSVKSLKAWGLGNARLEKWGAATRGWSLTRFTMSLREPAYAPLYGVPKAWSAGTTGPVSGGIVVAPLFTAVETERDDELDIERLAARIASYMAQQKGKLKGKIVLIEPARELEPPAAPESERYDEGKLTTLATAPEPFTPIEVQWPLTRLPEDPKKRRHLMESLPDEVEEDYYLRWTRVHDRLNAFLRDEGALAVLTTDQRGLGGIVFAEEGGSWEPGAPVPPPIISLAPEPYDRLARLAARGIAMTIDLDVAVRLLDEPQDGFNVVAEIPGGRKKDEVVMLGAHLDSWHGGTGATDNAAGCAVALEAMRVLKALDLKPDRTVRLALWGGEEEGLYGSRGYVKDHFGDPVSMTLRPEHARLAAYFNVDNGTGKIRGVYLQGNDMARPIFDSWLAPVHDLGSTTLAISNTGGTDHLSFDAVGLPGFQFIQDPLDYESRTHHSNLDVYDHVEAGDLMQASAILASFVYNAATRPEMLPRKPLPKPLAPMLRS
ncbi:MAG TPA: M20/M25/M40 family metallo-hydrolase, partial [Candidatus Polarisedimenticolia bacterium]|nr:M20/M25/M40 family metallo-hydrolase [Candidatus Polarisedimenticolia bacterium]